MTGLDGQDGGSTSENNRVLDKVRSTEVCADADVLDDPRDLQHSVDISERAREVKFATRKRLLAKPSDY